MIYLGIDISEKSIGWAVIEGTHRVDEGLIRNPKDEAKGQHLDRISGHIAHIIKKHSVGEVIIEDLNIRFIQVGKKLYQIHGVVKATVYRELGQEVFAYSASQWRSVLGIKVLTKAEKAELLPLARNKTHHKHLCDIKHRVISYVNLFYGTKYTYEENDITDAIGLILAHRGKK